jgi:hypothetical protein
MRQLSMATRGELTAVVGQRYREASRAEKARILDEFVVVTGFHRKHAMPLLRGSSWIYEETERKCAGSSLGGVGADLRQETEGAAATSDRVDGTTRPHGSGV